MPSPAARHTLPHVGTTGTQRPGIAPRADTQVNRLLWRGESRQRGVCLFAVRKIRCRNIPPIFETVGTPPSAWQAHGGGAGQRPIPPCNTAQAMAAEIPQSFDPAVSATIQSATGTYRARLEIGAADGDTQSLLCRIGRACFCRRILLRPMEETQRSVEKIMPHYLRRYV